MTVFKIFYFAALLVIVWADGNPDTGCITPEGKIMKASERHIEACKTLYVCDEKNQLHTYPACRTEPKCGNPKEHRDFDASKPWPKCCALDIC